MEPRLLTVARWIFQVSLVLVLALTSLRLLLTRTFIEVEYRTPNFPPDPYGFTLEDRLHWAPIALDYLLNDAGIEFLADLRFEDGQPVYNARELRHMADVKRLTQAFLTLWQVSLVVAGLLAVFFWRTGNLPLLRQGLRGGALWSLGFMLGLGVLLAVSFSFVFVGFHRLFFEGNTWLFPYSDTLIRLFPERFWRDTFIAFVSLTCLQALILLLVARRWQPA